MTEPQMPAPAAQNDAAPSDLPPPRGNIATAAAFVVNLIRDESEFQSLRTAWNELASQAPTFGVFLRHEWFDAAWQWRRANSEMNILCVRDGDRIVAIAPFVITSRRRRGVSLRTLEFLVVPDTQLCDILARPEHRAGAVAAIAHELFALRRRWDVIALSHLDADAPTGPALRAACAGYRLRTDMRDAEINLYVDLADPWPTFYAQRSRRLKKANNLIANRLQRAAREVRLDWFEAKNSTPEALQQAVRTAIQLSARSWKQDTGMSLDRPAPGAFFARLVEHARANDWLSLWLLRVDDTPVAMEFQLTCQGQIHALRADFDESFKSLSPGSYLNWKLLESLCGRGWQRYWFGPGENSYKLHWTDRHARLLRLTVFGTSWRGRFLGWLELTLIPRVKEWVRRSASAPTHARDRSQE